MNALALDIAKRIRLKQQSAAETVRAALGRIEKLDPAHNCVTAVLRDSAIADAEAVDRRIAAGEDVGPLAGVPFAVKNLFAIAGITTLAGLGPGAIAQIRKIQDTCKEPEIKLAIENALEAAKGKDK